MSRKNKNLSRRQILGGTAALAGAWAASHLTGDGLLPSARAQIVGPEKNALLLIITEGGYNALFSSADSFLNTSFGVTSGNVRQLANRLVVDASTYGTFP